MWIATNRFQIKNEFADLFEKHWRKRESFLGQMPEFMRFRFLRAPAEDSSTEFVSYTEWLTKAGFDQWIESAQMKKAHGNSTVPREAYCGPPQFKGYDLVLDEVPGGRSDYRSTWLDLRIEKDFSNESSSQRAIVEASKEAGLPKINVGPFEGRLLEILARSVSSKCAVEVGTLGGYSASWIARGLSKGGKLYSFEKSPKNAEVARENLRRAELSQCVEVIEGDARKQLAKFLEGSAPLDFVFIDADKASYGAYVEMLVPKLSSGGLIVCDNSYLWGAMNHFEVGKQAPNIKHENGDHSFNSDQVSGMFSCWQQLAVHPELASIVLPTGEGMAVGVKL
ncbi:hypothetical protein GW915_01575 [bacterium]|nr:hypothetical protein [bacterium]